MFERVFLKLKGGATFKGSLGRLAESALFYDETIVEMDYNWLSDALRATSPETLLRLQNEHSIRFFLPKGVSAIAETTVRFLPVYNFVIFSLGGTKEKAIRSDDDLIEYLLDHAYAEFPRPSTRKFLESCEFRGCAPSELEHNILVREISDRNAMTADMAIILRERAPTFAIPENFHFFLEKSNLVKGGGFVAKTNLSLRELAPHFSMLHESRLTYSSLMAAFYDHRRVISSGAQLGCDFDVDPVSEALFRHRLEEVVKRAAKVREEISLFQKAVFAGARSVAEAVNSGHRSLDEFLPVLEDARKFKRFLHQIGPEQGLIGTYVSEVSRSSWLDSLAPKAVRFTIFTGGGIIADIAFAGGAGTLGGVGLSIFDSFLFDKLAKGWKPHQFVDQNLRPFVADASVR